MSLEQPLEHAPALDESSADELFVGRRKERASISTSMAAVVAGHGRLDVLSGPAGIGKTRLAREIVTVARADGFRVLRGGCWEGDGAPAYWPWVEILRSFLAEPGDDSAAATELGPLLSAVSARVSVAPRAVGGGSQDAQQARFILFDWMCEVLLAQATCEPTMVVMDDLHWADTSSLLLLQFVAGRMANLPIALLVTSREPLPPLVKSILHHDWATHHALPGLNRDEASELVVARAAYRPPADVLDGLLGLTDGNPYFLRELAQLWRGGQGPTDAEAVLALPPSLLGFTLQQLDRLAPGGRNVLQAAAVIGREFEAELAATMTGLDIREAMVLLDEAVEHRILAPLTTTRFRFRHALVREALHDQLHTSARSRLHERVAIALDRQAAAGERVSPAVLAHHFSMGLPFTSRRLAGTYSIAAGELAHRAFAYEEAVFQFRRAQEVAGPTLPDTEACDLLLLLGAAEAGAGDWAASRHTFENAAALARTLDCPERFARAALGFKGMMLGTLPVDIEAVTMLQEAIERLAGRFAGTLVEVYSALSVSLYFSEDHACQAYYSDLAAELAERLKDDRLTAFALNAAVHTDWQPREVTRINSYADELLRLGIRTRDPFVSFNARLFRHWCLLTLGRARDAHQELTRASMGSGAAEHPRMAWQVALLTAGRHISRGELEAAAITLERSLHLGNRVHGSNPAHHHLLQTFQVARLTRDFQGWLSSSAAPLDRYSDSLTYNAARALLAAHFGYLDEARLILRPLANQRFETVPLNSFYLYALAVLSDAVVPCAERDWISSLYDRFLPYQHLNIVAAWGTVVDGSVSHYLGNLASALGRAQTAHDHYEHALEANTALESRPALARTQLAFAMLLSHHPIDSTFSPVALAGDAARNFRECGLAAYADQAAALSDSLRHPTPARSKPTDIGVDAAPIPHDFAHNNDSQNAIIRIGDLWLVRFSGRQTHVRHLVGFLHIAAIVAARGQPVHVLDMISSGLATSRASNDIGSDQQARRAYKQRLRVLSKEIDEAKALNDNGRLGPLQEEYDAIVRELSYSYGFSGRARPTGSPAERARISVKNRITSALNALRQHHGAAARHLHLSIKTGVFCQYLPDPPLEWTVDLLHTPRPTEQDY